MSDVNNELLVEIKKMVRLLSIIAIGDKKQIEQIEVLSKAGFQPKEIADLLGTTPNTVRVSLTKIKKLK
jgi:DNA-binding NarL/FixJ family response regulator